MNAEPGHYKWNAELNTFVKKSDKVYYPKSMFWPKRSVRGHKAVYDIATGKYFNSKTERQNYYDKNGFIEGERNEFTIT